MRKLLTANELAKTINVTSQTIWKWGREGKLETLRVGRCVRFYWEVS